MENLPSPGPPNKSDDCPTINSVQVRPSEQLLAVMPNGQLDIVSMGKVLAQSGYFKDIKSLSQGIVKIMLGQELGLGPLMSIMKLFIVKENPVISANLMASKIRQSGIYDYELLKLDAKHCEIRFTRKTVDGWKELMPTIDFTLEDALRAQLGGLNSQYNPRKGKDFDPDSNWAKWPRNMLFARCLSDGYRFHCPDVFSMAVYTPGDFELPINASGEIMGDMAPTHDSMPDTSVGTSAIDRIVKQRSSASEGRSPDTPTIPETKPAVVETKPGVFEPAEKPKKKTAPPAKCDVPALLKKMETAESIQALQLYGEQAKTAPDEDRDTLRQIYKMRMGQLCSPIADLSLKAPVQPVTPAPAVTADTVKPPLPADAEEWI